MGHVCLSTFTQCARDEGLGSSVASILRMHSTGFLSAGFPNWLEGIYNFAGADLRTATGWGGGLIAHFP